MVDADDSVDLSDIEDLQSDFEQHGIGTPTSDLSPSTNNRVRARTELPKARLSDPETGPLKIKKRSPFLKGRTAISAQPKHLSGVDLKRIVEETRTKTESLIKQQQNQNEKIKQRLIDSGKSLQEIDKTKGGIGVSSEDIKRELTNALIAKPNQYAKQNEEKKSFDLQRNLRNKGPCTHLPDPSQPLPPLKKPREFRTSDIERCLELLKAGEILPLHTVQFICAKLSELLMKESNVRNIASPVSVVGDVHGQFYDLMEMFKVGGEAPLTNYLFLGDYVDRGHYSVETFSYLACIKMRYPDRVTLIRGNHESRMTTTSYGFMTECQEKYGTLEAWKAFTDMFDYLPVAATIDGEIFATHGGLSPTLHTIDAVRVIFRFREIPETGPFCDLMWADPDPDNLGFNYSSRLASYTFGKDVYDKFMHLNKLSYMIRAHQLCQGGYQILWDNFATVWSAPNYCYRCGNKAAICEISNNCRSKHFNVYTAAPTPERPVRTDKKKEPRVTHFDM